MSRNVIEQRQFENEVAHELSSIERKFVLHKDKLQGIFNDLQSFIDDPDLPSDWLAVLSNKKAQGKALIQSMINGIS